VLKDLDKFQSSGGTLFAINKNIDLVAQRMFFVSDVPKGETRGNHAHLKDKQLLICVSGKILVSLDDGKETKKEIMQPGQSLLMKNMVWGEQTYLTGKDILLVLCSMEYDEKDYIKDYQQFLRIINE